MDSKGSQLTVSYAIRLRVDRESRLTSKVLRLKAGPDISMPKEKLALPDLVSASGRPKVVENPVARDCRSQLLSLSLSACVIISYTRYRI